LPKDVAEPKVSPDRVFGSSSVISFKTRDDSPRKIAELPITHEYRFVPSAVQAW
jgi:hypothetical protein